MDTDARRATAIDAIRATGGRITADRLAIIDALIEGGDHLTVDELATAVRAREPKVDLTTIYRTMDLLESLGLGFHVHVGHGPARWHLSDSPHQHLVCDGCGSVTDAPDDLLAPLRDRIREETGFVIDPHHFSLVGRCAACAAGGPEG